MRSALRFLAAGGTALGGTRWPAPSTAGPGAWLDADGPVADGSGVHACTAETLADWIDDELWEVELDGWVDERDGLLHAARGRLLRRVDSWDEAAALAFTLACVVRLCDSALATGADDALEYLADAALLARGGRPESHELLPWAGGSPAPAAIAGNIGFVTAHAAGATGAARSGSPDAYEAGYATERARQRAWLEARLARDLRPSTPA